MFAWVPWVVGADGFVGRHGGEGYEGCKFTTSPVGFLAVMFKRVRRDCLEIGGTDMGKVLAGGFLRERDFEGRDGEEEVVGKKKDVEGRRDGEEGVLRDGELEEGEIEEEL